MNRPVACPSCGTKFRPDVVVESSHDAYETMVVGGMPVREYARQRGIAPATAMLYRRCGTAIRVVGVDPDSKLFTTLQQYATANRADIAREIERPGATPGTVQALLDTTPAQSRSKRTTNDG